MFRWLKGKTTKSNTELAWAKAQDAIERFGELIEKYPGAYIDEKFLPLPKEAMKACFKMGWSVSTTDGQRELMKTGWYMLSFFQPGVGDSPVSADVSANASPQEVAAKLGKYLETSKRAEAATVTDKAEFEQFVKNSRS